MGSAYTTRRGAAQRGAARSMGFETGWKPANVFQYTGSGQKNAERIASGRKVGITCVTCTRLLINCRRENHNQSRYLEWIHTRRNYTLIRQDYFNYIFLAARYSTAKVRAKMYVHHKNSQINISLCKYVSIALQCKLLISLCVTSKTPCFVWHVTVS